MTLRLTPIAAALCMAGCASVTPAQQVALTATAATAATTLGNVAVANNTTAAKIVADGILICSVKGVLTAALGINVTGATQQVMDAACGVLGGVGAALPESANPAAVPAVQVTLKPA